MKQNLAKRLVGVSVLATQLGGRFLLPAEVFGRVGGGQSYGGGGGHGDGGGGAGAIIWLLFQFVRLLVYLTIEDSVIGIPLDIIIMAAGIFYFVKTHPTGSPAFFSFLIEASPTATVLCV